MCLVFVMDPKILGSQRIGEPLTQAFFAAVAWLREDLRRRSSDLALLRGDPQAELPAFAARIGAHALFFNEDYEPDAIARDEGVRGVFARAGIAVHASTDHVYFGGDEVLRDDGAPYRVFTPYARRWALLAHRSPREPVESEALLNGTLLEREEIGATADAPPSTGRYEVNESAAEGRLHAFVSGAGVRRYAIDRDFPAIDGTSRLSVHLRAGTIGIRSCVSAGLRAGADAWVNELAWRDFFQAILKHYPHVAGAPFLAAGERIRWRRAPAEFDAWCAGETGYPLVDAAMRQLNETGWMHNRLRMVAASFLSKHLLIDWRDGERYFERRLVDADLAANNGGWQWSASTGTDAAPYFRIFNPLLQSKRYDPDGQFIRAMLAQMRGVRGARVHDPWKKPIVEHRAARERALAAYSQAFRGASISR